MEEIKDEFQGFDDSFQGFPKRLPDDCVEYSLFIIDSKLNSQKELFTRLEAVRKEAQALTASLLEDYIWQRDAFKLEIESGKGRMHLRGRSNYGDSVEDEWLIVFILKELTKRFPELWVKVVDTDGEFLLIEAANALPRWLNPEIADNRVWIHGDHLRIIPLSAVPPSSSVSKAIPVSRSLSLDEALQTLTSTPEILIHSSLIEAEAFYRLRNYPSQILASLHNAMVTIPRKLAFIVHDRPTSIAPAIEAFYLRDPIALRSLQRTSSDLTFPPVDLVTVSVRFTKVLYAQLRSQEFLPPTAWKDELSRFEGNAESSGLISKQYMQCEVGMKVTSGFEMLLKDTKYADNRAVREIKILIDDLAADNNGNLPTDEEISQWCDVTKEDDEKWLDINFEDFERELQGQNQSYQSTEASETFRPGPSSGFGDAKTQADLKKIVERFEAFLNDDSAGVDGADLDEMDLDNDDEIEDGYSEDEDKDVSFDEVEFAIMMREMMGMPSEGLDDVNDRPSNGEIRTINEIGNDEEDRQKEEEDAEIRKVMQRLEAELQEEGALNLDLFPDKLPALKSHNGHESSVARGMVDESDEEVDIDFNLAKNLLESFKSQAGMAGPGGNLLGMMGIRLPRDDEDEEISPEETK